MQVHIKTSFPGSNLPEWIIIELQGDLESRSESEMKGKFIGDLNFTKKGIPVLIVGHHILYGKIVTMEKPFVALKKSEPGCEGNVEESIEYTVDAVIKKKILFKTRPKPIIVNNPKPSS